MKIVLAPNALKGTSKNPCYEKIGFLISAKSPRL